MPLTFVVSPDPQDFSLAVSASAVSIPSGGVAQTTVTITPTNTLNGNVTFSCSGLPSNAICTFLPAVVTFTPATDQPTQVVVSLWTGIGPGTVPTASLRPGKSIFWLAVLCPLGLLALSRKRFAALSRLAGIVCVLIGLAGTITGCGNNLPAATAATPGGVSTVTLEATGPNGQTHALPVTFTVISQ
jgi:hypothetical protein